MCMITYVPEGILPDRDALMNGTAYNTDGHGFAIIIDGKIRVGRGWHAYDMVNEFIGLRTKYPGMPAMFHSRMATHGTTDKSNIHPFFIGGDQRTVIAHNGIFTNLGMPKHSLRSDTRHWAEVWLPRARKMNLLTEKGRGKAEQWMGKFNKVTMLTTNPKANADGYILNEGAGRWDDGVWYSNDDYLGMPKYTAIGSGYTFHGAWVDAELEDDPRWNAGWSTEDDERYAEYWAGRHETKELGYGYNEDKMPCDFCEGVGTISALTDICTICQMCASCSQAAVTCQCK